MKKIVCLSIACMALTANSVDLGNINVTESKTISNVHKKDVKSADIADALSKDISSINIIRRSGIANDITLRGQKRDNINIIIDGGKVYGACPNRMDPPLSHILASNIDTIEVNEGPFDVENFGSLSGSVKVTTKKPQNGQDVDIQLNVGSYGYKKGVISISEASDKLGVLFTYSRETSNQYKDGNNNNLSQQLDTYISSHLTGNMLQDNILKSSAYSTSNRSNDAYAKSSFMAKVYSQLDDNKMLEISYTGNRSKNVLYSSSPMDADYDDSDLFNVKLNIQDSSSYSKDLEINLYSSKVDHPMSNTYRDSSQNGANIITHKLESSISGAKIKNSFDILNSHIEYGVDISRRNWNGRYIKNGNPLTVNGQDGRSISDVDTTNKALFSKVRTSFDKFHLDYALRLDSTTISPKQGSQEQKKYNSIGGSIKASLKNNNSKIFVVVGTASRVPDARELYFYNKSKDSTTLNAEIGNTNLKQIKNHEIDIGLNHDFEDGKLGAKVFYSKLKDYIYYNSSKINNRFENIDATLYGAELVGSYYINDYITLKSAINYTKGNKDTLPSTQTNTNLADITPLKSITTLDYDDEKINVKLEVISIKDWSSFDSDNGEIQLPGYAILNLKTKYKFTKKFSLELGVENVLDKTYKTSNSYKDVTLVTGGSEVMLLNEPGRYFYTNLNYKF